MRALTLVMLVACGGSSSVPTVAELYGQWTGSADGNTRDFVFAAASDGAHPELAGMVDVYVLSNNGAVVQTGHYSIEKRAVVGHGTTDALVTRDASNGNTYGNAILDWTGSSLTISSESASSGQLTLQLRP